MLRFWVLGYERVNTYSTNVIALNEAAGVVNKNLALDSAHVVVPHSREWEELNQDETFVEKFRDVSYYINDDCQGVQRQSRPYTTLSITLKNNKSYL